MDPIREHPHSVFVHEWTWANFSCGIKLPDSILWRIGDLNLQGYVYNSADQLPRLQGVTAERSFPEDITGKIQTETIELWLQQSWTELQWSVSSSIPAAAQSDTASASLLCCMWTTMVHLVLENADLMDFHMLLCSVSTSKIMNAQ